MFILYIGIGYTTLPLTSIWGELSNRTHTPLHPHTPTVYEYEPGTEITKFKNHCTSFFHAFSSAYCYYQCEENTHSSVTQVVIKICWEKKRKKTNWKAGNDWKAIQIDILMILFHLVFLFICNNIFATSFNILTPNTKMESLMPNWTLWV